jgi:hypothetical protein
MNIYSKNVMERDHLGDLDIDVRTVILRWIGDYELYSSDPGSVIVVGFCEHGNESSVP